MDTGEIYARASGAKPAVDVLERLFDLQLHYNAVIVEGATSEVLKLLHDAADEIGRLRAEIRKLKLVRLKHECPMVERDRQVIDDTIVKLKDMKCFE